MRVHGINIDELLNTPLDQLGALTDDKKMARLSFVCGLLGIGFGCLLAKVLEALLGGMLVASMGASGITFNATPTLGAIGLSFGVSVGIGVLFGYLPANKAAKLNPIDALRYD